jgi:hypothetical protein
MIDEKQMDRLLENEKEWRKHLLTEVEKIKVEVGRQNDIIMRIKVKTIAIAASLGAGVSPIWDFIKDLK